MSYFVHETAVIDAGAEIGDGCRIWHFVHICAGSRIGRNAVIGQNVFIAGGAIVGHGCKIQNNVSIFEGVTFEDEVFCGPGMSFTNVINPRAGIEKKTELRSTRVGRGATFGANCTIVCGTTIGRYAFVAAGAVVTGDVPDYALMVGVPARHSGWMSEHGERLDLPLGGFGEATCPATGELYQLREGKCSRTP